MTYAAYLFDLDGVLVDTRDWIREAYRETARRYGFEASDDLLSDLYGRPLLACYRILHPAGDPDALINCHRTFQNENMRLQRIFTGAKETLEALKGRGAKTALISSRTGPSTKRTLETFGLEGLLDRVVWPEECQKHKPDPEPVLIALRELAVGAGEALVVGDTPNDIRAGQAAGTDTAGATYGFVGEKVRDANPTHLLSSITSLLDL